MKSSITSCEHCYCENETVFYKSTTGGQVHKVCCNCGHRMLKGGLSFTPPVYPTTIRYDSTVETGDIPYEGSSSKSFDEDMGRGVC